MSRRRGRGGGKGRSGARTSDRAGSGSAGGGDRSRPTSSRGSGKASSRGDSGHRFRGRQRRDEEGGAEDVAFTRHQDALAADPILTQAARETTARIAKLLQDGDVIRRQRAQVGAQEREAAARGAIHLDPWQVEALDVLRSGNCLVVDAPTTAGKTRIVEAFLAENIHRPGFRAAYTTPVKSLSNDKLREFRALFGADKVGIATGDIKENLNAPLVVATLESYRNSLLGVDPDLQRNLVVFDEYHYLQDESRGSAWEEAIILTPRRCQLLLLSASVANGRNFASWISGLFDKDCRFIRVENRPVPLVHLVYLGGKWVEAALLSPESLLQRDRIPPTGPAHFREVAARAHAMLAAGLGPCILYAAKRLSCETTAFAIAKDVEPLEPERQTAIADTLETLDRDRATLRHFPRDLLHMIRTQGIGYHHSGLPPMARIAIETLLKSGLLQACVSTMGLSLGINFMVRSTMISDTMRPGESGPVVYSPAEVMQMLGRAGRRGHDACGFCLWPSADAYSRLGRTAGPMECQSRLKNDPATFLSLVGKGYDLGAIEEFYDKSFQRHSRPDADLSLVTVDRLEKRLRSRLPCVSPAHEATSFWRRRSSRCETCHLRRDCHHFLRYKKTGALARIHMHLHTIGALDARDQLTNFGSLARYFPQNGGMVVARYLEEGRISEERLMDAAQLFASFALASHRRIGAPRYRLPYEESRVLNDLIAMYPPELFPENYDQFGRQDELTYREYNPAAGHVIAEWLRGCGWDVLQETLVTDSLAPGDLMALIFRVGTYLQSLAQSDLPGISESARALRLELLRPPFAEILDL